MEGLKNSYLTTSVTEAFEEIGQNVIQKEREYQALKKVGVENPHVSPDFLGRTVEFATSPQALLEGAMGFFGGAAQQIAVQEPSKMLDNKRYNNLQQKKETLYSEIDQTDDPQKKASLQVELETINQELKGTLRGAYEAQQEAYRLLRVQFNAGSSTIFQMGEARANMINSRINYYASYYQYLYNRMLLGFYQGLNIADLLNQTDEEE